MIERLKVGSLAELRAAYNATYARAEYGEREALYALVEELLEAASGTPVLDVGCGAGPWLAYGQAKGLRTIGLDLSDEAVRKAVSRGHGPAFVAQGERLPFSEGAFTRAVCLGNLEHFLDPAAGAAELRRVLAPGARAVVMLPNSRYSGDLWRRLLGRGGPDHHQAIDRFGTDAEWRALLEAAGLVVREVRRWDKGKRWKALFPFALAYHYVYAVERPAPPPGEGD